MWSYYELTTAQTQADRRASVEYSVSPAAAREFREDAIARALNEQHQSVKIQEQVARQTANQLLYGAIKAFFRRDAAIAR